MRTNLNILMDRVFDYICLISEGEKELSSKIINRVRGKFPKDNDYIDGLIKLYSDMPKELKSERAKYLMEHPNCKLKF